MRFGVSATIERIVQRIYFDHNATTPVHPAVVARMAEVLREEFGNPSSVHHFGQQAKAVMDEARTSIGTLIGAEPAEIVFTSGGTESDNFAIRGVAEALQPTGRDHLIASSIEHEAVLNTLKALGRRGWKTTLLDVDDSGVVSPDALRAAITDKTALVSVMHANNEIGTVQPIAELARIARERGALFHTDAVQSAGKITVDVKALGVDLLSLSAHKFYGPKGVGAIWIRRGVRLVPLLTGGRQERSRRAGTENVAGAVGLAVAYELTVRERPETVKRLRRQRDRLRQAVLAVAGVELTGHPRDRLPGHLSVIARETDGETVALSLDLEGVACSTGSACTTGSPEPSHVLAAMGYPDEEARGAVRFSIGRTTTDDEIARAVEIVPRVVARMRAGAAVMRADPLGQEVGA